MFKAFMTRKLYISFKSLRVAECFITSNERGLAVGRNRDIEVLSRKFRARLKALDGIVMLGFVDSHKHLD